MAKMRSAEQIRAEGPRSSYLGSNWQNYRQYCADLYNALRQELMQTGRSDCLESLRMDISEARPQNYSNLLMSRNLYLTYLTLLYIRTDLIEHDPAFVQECLQGKYTGMEGETWADLQKEVLNGVYYTTPISTFLMLIDGIRGFAKANFPAEPEAAVPKKKPSGIVIQGGSQPQAAGPDDRGQTGEPSSPTDAVRVEAERLLAEARKKNEEADRKLKEAEQLLSRIRSESDRRESLQEEFRALHEQNDQAESILESARAAARKITDDAAGKAGEIRKAADDYYEQQYGEAQNRAREITSDAETEARDKAAALVKRYLRGEIAGETAPETAFPTDEAELVRLSKDAAVEGAYQMERDLREQLDGFKHQLQERLNDWRRSLYGQEYGPLAEYYQTLYRQLGSGSKTVQAIASQIERIAAAEEPSEQDRDLLRRLRNLQKELSSLVEQLGKVMGGLGLEILLPEKGDPFDREYHVDEEAESGSEAVDGVIETVRFPAVCGRDSAGYRIPIRPAAVTIKVIEPEDNDQ